VGRGVVGDSVPRRRPHWEAQDEPHIKSSDFSSEVS
jgi:hypothetical protein